MSAGEFLNVSYKIMNYPSTQLTKGLGVWGKALAVHA